METKQRYVKRAENAQPLEDFMRHNCFADMAKKLDNGEPLTQEEKRRINATAFYSPYPQHVRLGGGWSIDFSDVLTECYLCDFIVDYDLKFGIAWVSDRAELEAILHDRKLGRKVGTCLQEDIIHQLAPEELNPI